MGDFQNYKQVFDQIDEDAIEVDDAFDVLEMRMFVEKRLAEAKKCYLFIHGYTARDFYVYSSAKNTQAKQNHFQQPSPTAKKISMRPTILTAPAQRLELKRGH